MSALMLPLEQRWEGPPAKHQIAVWKSSLPFVENSRGVLIHRPRAVTQYKLGNWPEHIGIGYWCGNSVSGNRNITFLSKSPSGKLLCAVCEARATLAGRPSADSICGRHVHLGRVVAAQTCCSHTPPEKP